MLYPLERRDTPSREEIDSLPKTEDLLTFALLLDTRPLVLPARHGRMSSEVKADFEKLWGEEELSV